MLAPQIVEERQNNPTSSQRAKDRDCGWHLAFLVRIGTSWSFVLTSAVHLTNYWYPSENWGLSGV